MIYIKKILAILCAAVLVLTAVGCDDGAPDTRIYFELPSVPATADPQTASTAAELMLVRNLYEGLLRYDEQGNIVCGVAEDYAVNGLTYTFTLREDAKWDSGEKLTSADFVFGLRRAVDPDTRSPFVSRLFSVTNAEAIYSGRQNVDSLGVSAPDEHTLVITLCREDEDFLHNLTTAPFMPCNEEFFKESVGKYGLEREYVLANGSYYMGKWNQEDFGIRLYRNAEYTGAFETKNGAVFLSHSSESTALGELAEENVDAAILNSGELETAQKTGLATVSTENICWVLTLGSEMSVNMRMSFAKSVDSSVYAIDLPSDFRVADSLYPSVLGTDASVSRAGMTDYDPSGAKELFSSAVKALEDKKFPQTALKYYSGAPVKDAVTSIVAHWQQNLSAFINIEGVDSAETLISQLDNQTLQMAVFPVTADSASVKEYLAIFGAEYSGSAAEAQAGIVKDNRIIPIAFQKTALAYHEVLSGLNIDPGNGHVDFSWVVKEK